MMSSALEEQFVRPGLKQEGMKKVKKKLEGFLRSPLFQGKDKLKPASE